ncbi:MAG TPA: ABC transporter ATP-binding protein [Acidimicrobiia bacterium]|nr:ABC transporter ATP-binding protein [Acidimicrobiia bacterium]
MTGRPLLSVERVSVAYGEARAVFDVTFEIPDGGALALLGANGAGKSSVAGAIAGVVRPASGRIVFDGRDITGWPSHRVSRLGVAFVPEQRSIFPHLSVLDNVRVQIRYVVPRAERATAVERALELFPVLAQRRRQPAGTLSGGEQQMLGLARVLAAPPRVLIADEMSLGLAPKLVDLVFESLARARAEGVTTLLVEQYVDRALEFADDALILRRGEAVWQGAASSAGPETLAGYLGDSVGGASESSPAS